MAIHFPPACALGEDIDETTSSRHDIPEITVPQSWIDAIEDDRCAGVGHACEFAHRIAESGAFDGVHLIPGVRYRETAARLEK